ncbi:LPS assembly lipoprotein LptE [Halorhodospira halochloris]|uniref:LPS-assembly lipoprotein LptE n=1 Tax=Halorhodospira halochloris TaxID=1052 RepID=UPI001EE7C825|nr:LPS assembly lipoprotein LptE [Halorhodospira halochloris]MCG5548098.1 LPS assembly lipoprotein LptE [Halorhodospira halochloris]
MSLSEMKIGHFRVYFRGALLAVVLLGLVVSACGWQLRGSPGGISLAGQGLYVIDDIGSSDLRRAVRRGIEGAGGRQVESRNEADLVVILHTRSSDRETAAVGVGGDAEEYRLEYRVSYSVEDSAGDVLIDRQAANAMRTFAEVEGGADQRRRREDDIEEELRDEVARMIMLRLQVI